MNENSKINNFFFQNRTKISFISGLLAAIAVIVVDYVLTGFALEQGGGQVFFNTKAGVWLPALGVVMLFAAMIKANVRFSVWVGVVLGGAMSNMLDFVVYSAVIDYWHIANIWFNLADVGIVVGLVLLFADDK